MVGGLIGGLIGIIVWLLLAMLVGMLASSKGKSFFLYFFLSIILSPVIALLIILITADNGRIVENENPKVNSIKNENLDLEQSSIQKLNDETSKVILIKDKINISTKDIKEIVLNNYDEKYRHTVKKDNESGFFIKSTAGEFEKTYVQLQNKEDKFIIEFYNIDIPEDIKELVNKKEIKNINLNDKTENIDKLFELSKLYKDGFLNKTEFEEQKALLLNAK